VDGWFKWVGGDDCTLGFGWEVSVREELWVGDELGEVDGVGML